MICIKRAEPSHLDGMARCHIACFPDPFISRMGLRFAKAFYETYLTEPEGLSFAAVDESDGKVVGVAIGGGPDIRAMFMAKAPRHFPFTFLSRCLTDRVVRSAVLGHLRSKLGCGGKSRIDEEVSNWPQPGDMPWAKLQVIAVLTDHRGTGAATALIQAFQVACREDGYRSMDLSVHTDNARGIAFYKKNGWQVVEKTEGTTYMRRSSND